MQNDQIARLFDQLGDLLEIPEVQPFPSPRVSERVSNDRVALGIDGGHHRRSRCETD